MDRRDMKAGEDHRSLGGGGVLEFVLKYVSCYLCKERITEILSRGFALKQADQIYNLNGGIAGIILGGHQMIEKRGEQSFSLCVPGLATVD